MYQHNWKYLIGYEVGGNVNQIWLNGVRIHAFAFVARDTAVSSITLYVTTASNGGIGVGNFRVEIFPRDPNNNNLPDTTGDPIATAYNSVPINATGFYTIGGFSSHTLTIGERYWLVFSNLEGNPTSQNLGINPTDTPVNADTNWAHALATYSTSWAYHGTNRLYGGISILYSNGARDGYPANMVGTDSLTCYGNRMLGVRVSIPQGVSISLAGFRMFGARGGSGCTIAPRVVRASDGQVLATGMPIPGNAELGYGSNRCHFFESPVDLPTGDYYVVICNPNGDGNSSNYYKSSSIVRFADGNAPLPFGMRYAVYDGTSWSVDTQRVPRVFQLIIEDIEVTGNGGSSIYYPRHRILS